MKMKLFIAVIAILWIGMILAIGMESIVKFNTLTLTKPVGFDVGRVVFSAFNKMQGLMLMLMIIGAVTAPVSLWDKSFIFLIAVILCLQAFWLFPALSQRVDLILAGITPPPSYQHALYGLFEIGKLFLLSIVGIKLLTKT